MAKYVIHVYKYTGEGFDKEYYKSFGYAYSDNELDSVLSSARAVYPSYDYYVDYQEL